MPRPSDPAILERAHSLANKAVHTVALQHRRLRGAEPEDDTFIFRWWADLQFLIVALRRLRRAAQLASHVPTVTNDIDQALRQFDRALPGLATMRNIGEHIDDYALETPRRRHNVGRRELPTPPRATQRRHKAVVVAVEAIGHHHPKRNASLLGGGDQLGGKLGLGPKFRDRSCPWPAWTPACRAPGAAASSSAHPPTGWSPPRCRCRSCPPTPDTGGHVRGVAAVLAVAGVVDHQHPPLVGRGRRISLQQPDPLLVDPLMVPGWSLAVLLGLLTDSAELLAS
jgi:hypothetical protein